MRSPGSATTAASTCFVGTGGRGMGPSHGSTRRTAASCAHWPRWRSPRTGSARLPRRPAARSSCATRARRRTTSSWAPDHWGYGRCNPIDSGCFVTETVECLQVFVIQPAHCPAAGRTEHLIPHHPGHPESAVHAAQPVLASLLVPQDLLGRLVGHTPALAADVLDPAVKLEQMTANAYVGLGPATSVDDLELCLGFADAEFDDHQPQQ